MFQVYSQNVWNCLPAAYRNRMVRQLIAHVDADVCLFQECAPDTVRRGEDEAPLPALMSDGYQEICPELAHKNFTPIFIKKDAFHVLDSGWELYDGLNDADSKSVTWAVLEDKHTAARFAVVSTHLWWRWDDDGDNAQRLDNVRQLKALCDKLVNKYGVPVIVGGDFNCGENAPTGEEPYYFALEQGFRDLRRTAPVTTRQYTHRYCNPVAVDGRHDTGAAPDENLDYIFTYGQGVNPTRFAVLTDEVALASSDHCPLLGEFEI